MDFQKICDGIAAMTCVVSVEKLEGGGYGKICLVAGNKSYIDSVEHPMPGVRMLKDKFEPNTEYTCYMTRDLNFEDFCYRSAVEKKCLHSYAHPDRYDVWFNMTFLPVDAEDGNICYCTYTMEINMVADSKRLSNVSGEVAGAVLETCIKLRGTSDFDQTINEVIGDIRELCKAEYCCILLTDPVERRCWVLGEDVEDKSSLLSMKEYVDDKFYNIVETWEDTISGSNCLIVKNRQDMEVVRERNPIWVESLESAGVETIVLFSLKSRNELLGYIWAINFNAEDAGMIKETLELTTFILASELANHMLVDRLKVLSSRDMLTGVNNRNEMNNLVDEISREGDQQNTSIGIVFTDLNGLKTVNDVHGHAAGDRLLKDAASALREVFSEKMIYRAGGDEFTVIIPAIKEKELSKKVKELRKASGNYEGVTFAIGYSIAENSSDIHRALREADERMYEDKENYYIEHPDKRRVNLIGN